MTYTPQAPPAAAHLRPRRRWAWVLIPSAVVIVATVGYLVSAYLPPVPETSRVDVSDGLWHYVLLLGHVGCAGIATLSGLLQFWPTLRNKHPRVHRWSGRIYFYGGIFPAIVCVAAIIWTSPAGVSNVIGQYTLLGLWTFTGVAGLRAARARRFADHRKWMIRNYAATLTALVTRPMGVIMLLIVLTQADTPQYNNDQLVILHDMASGGIWLSIMITMGIAEYYIYRKYGNGRRRRGINGSAPDAKADAPAPAAAPPSGGVYPANATPAVVAPRWTGPRRR